MILYIKAMRMAGEYSIEQMAKNLKISEITYKKIEDGKMQAGKINKKKIFNFFKLPVDKLLSPINLDSIIYYHFQEHANSKCCEWCCDKYA